MTKMFIPNLAASEYVLQPVTTHMLSSVQGVLNIVL